MKPPRPHTPWPNPRRTARPARWRPTGSGNVSARDEWSLPANRTKIKQAQKDKFLTRVLITPELILNLKGFEKKSQVSTQKDFWFSRKYRPVYWKDYFQDFKHSSHSRDNTIGLSFKKQTEAENHFRSHPLTIYHWKKNIRNVCVFSLSGHQVRHCDVRGLDCTGSSSKNPLESHSTRNQETLSMDEIIILTPGSDNSTLDSAITVTDVGEIV